MTTFAIGAVRGDFQTLVKLLEKIRFNNSRDKSWFSGDVVNGDPDSLAVLRFIKDLGIQADTCDEALAAQKIFLGHWVIPKDDAVSGIFSPDSDCAHGDALTARAMIDAPKKITMPCSEQSS